MAHSIIKITARNTAATRVHVDAQGYDSNGRYWGVSTETLYALEPKETAKYEFVGRSGQRRELVHVRGTDAADARARAMTCATSWFLTERE